MLALVKDLESFDTLKYGGRQGQNRITKHKPMSQNPKEYHKPKTEPQNTKQNHTTLHRITKP